MPIWPSIALTLGRPDHNGTSNFWSGFNRRHGSGLKHQEFSRHEILVTGRGFSGKERYCTIDYYPMCPCQNV